MGTSDTTTDIHTKGETLESRVGAEAYARSGAPRAQSAGGGSLQRIVQRIFSFPAMLASLFVGAVFVATRSFSVDPDLWWHIKVGDTILRTHGWPTTDVYSFTVYGQPWLVYEWLGDVAIAGAYRWGGLRGLELLQLAVGSAIILALYGLATSVTEKSKAGFIAVSLVFVLAVVSFSMRPQMFGYLFLALTLIALERFRQGNQGAIWWLPLLMLAWVNTHGSWIIGLGTIFLYWVAGLFEFRIGGLEGKRWTEKERRMMSLIFLLSLITVPITPYGTRIAVSPFEFAFSLPLNAKYINEWQPMPFDLPGGKLFLILLLGVILLQVAYQFRWRVETFLLFLFGTMMACIHARFLLIFVPFFVPVLGSILRPWIPHYNQAKDKYALNAVLMTCIGAAIIYYLPSHTDLQYDVAKQFPVAAVEYLNRRPVPGPMYNNYGFGGYLVWSRGPEHKVFLDGRGDVYERGGVLADYLHISRLEPGALAVLSAYGVQSCLVQRDEPLATALSASPEWKRIYFDSVSALFVRAQQIGSQP